MQNRTVSFQTANIIGGQKYKQFTYVLELRPEGSRPMTGTVFMFNYNYLSSTRITPLDVSPYFLNFSTELSLRTWMLLI